MIIDLLECTSMLAGTTENIPDGSTSGSSEGLCSYGLSSWRSRWASDGRALVRLAPLKTLRQRG